MASDDPGVRSTRAGHSRSHRRQTELTSELQATLAIVSRRARADVCAREDVLSFLSAALQPVIEFAYITALEWQHADCAASEAWFDPGTTKNGDRHVFPMADELRRLLERQHEAHMKLKKAGRLSRRCARARGDAVHQPQRLIANSSATHRERSHDAAVYERSSQLNYPRIYRARRRAPVRTGNH